jgi:hypothetical protein
MKRAETMRLAWLAGALVLATAGCQQDEQEPPVSVEPAGSARVVVALPRSLPVSQVARVEVIATPAEGREARVDLAGSGALWRGLLRQVRSGAGTAVVARALGAGDVALAQVELSGVELVRNRPALLVLVPQAPAQAEPTGNAAPLIDAVVGSDATVWPEAPLALRALAHDPNVGEALTYAWRATEGSFSEATSATPVWTAPARRGEVTLTLQVTDARGAAATLDFTVRVERGGTAGAEGQAVFNRWPSLTGLDAQPSPRVRVRTPVALQAASVDEDGDALTYAWVASCQGAFDNAAVARASFTPSTVPPGACNNCRLSLTVRDGMGGQREGTVELCVGDPRPPTIIATSQSSPGAVAGTVVRLLATAEDPQNEPLTFEWTANTGVLGPPSSEGGTGEVDWTALACVPADVVPTIGLTVTNASGLSDTHTFMVPWADRRCGARAPCPLSLGATRVRLEADCATESTVFIPDGYTFDGAGYTLTAVDPDGGRFLGAVLRNRGGEAHVRGVRVVAGGLTDRGNCDAAADALTGILLEGANGSIQDSEVAGVSQREARSQCQEGVAIAVRHEEGADEAVRVDVLRNTVSGYQKGGITVSGRVEVTVEGNTVDGGGPVAHIARNGITVTDGTRGRVTGNTVRGNAYTGTDFVAAGILVAGGPRGEHPLVEDLVIRGNTVTDNTVGIALAQPEVGTPGLQVLENTLSSVRQAGVFQAGLLDYYGVGYRISRNRISGAGYDPATEPESTYALYLEGVGAATRGVFLTPARTVAAGACSEAVVVQSQDARGNVAALAAPTLVAEPSGAAGGVTLYRNPECTDALPVSGTGQAAVLEAPQHEAVFYFRATQAGTLTLTVTGEGVSAAQEGHTVR